MGAKTILVTGFEPFGGESINSSAQVAASLDRKLIEGRTVISATLPCVFSTASEALEQYIVEAKPELVICLGQAGGRAAISLERVALNVSDARFADNAGEQPVDAQVIDDGPVAYWSGLPIKAMAHAVREAGYPAEISNSAGTFVCNHVFYGLMHLLAGKKGIRGGFIHVPYLPVQAALSLQSVPCLSLVDMVDAIAIAMTAALGGKRERVG